MLLRLVLALVLLISAQCGLADPLAVHYVEPYSVDLPIHGFPGELMQPDFPNALKVRAARGETTACAVLALVASADLGPLTLEPSGTAEGSGPSDVCLRLRLIKGLPRHSRYLDSAFGRELLSRLGAAYPDVLITDERLFDRDIEGRRGDRVLSVPPAGPVTTTALSAGEVKYVLASLVVPETAQPGLHHCAAAIRAEAGELHIDVPVEVSVLPFALPGHGKVLQVANDFGSPDNDHFSAALKDQAEHGMNATRLMGKMSSRESAKTLAELERLGFSYLVQAALPDDAEQANPAFGSLRRFFYGVDEPQPKTREAGRPWSRMAEQVRLAEKVHRLGGLVTTSLPYPLALALSKRESSLYQQLADYGLKDAFQPLDWANYGLALQRLGRGSAERARNRGSQQMREALEPDGTEEGTQEESLFEYISALQQEYAMGKTGDGRTPLSKHNWLETYYFPLGYFKSPILARLLFGYYLFDSHLDGASAWTLYRPNGGPFTDEDGPDPIIAYPSSEGMVPTYWWESLRDGVNDLRYCRLAEELVLGVERSSVAPGLKMRARLVAILSPYRSLTVGDLRIDQAMRLSSFRETRAELVDFILELQQMLSKTGQTADGADTAQQLDRREE